ncbi:MAG: glycoside hydrolase family 2 TIM barrel-domain containing protein [Acutalibacteraceae bacterium]|nr:glycoside hydrolase family 2 TIM barrel-domain containing protein [Acutalibacteraceae bacterium]
MIEMKTRWTDEVDLDCPLPEYPRPQLVRSEWQNLNGRFEYAITGLDEAFPENYDGEIIVPFAPECYLSGVNKTIEPDNFLWYRKKFILKNSFAGKKCIINFGAVDWKCKVYINKNLVAEHTGGYVPFSADISDAIIDGENELIVRVYDPTDANWQDRGKQVRESKGFWYTATSGIWQTVWLEPVEEVYVKSLKITPDIDNGIVKLTTNFNGEATIKAIVKEGDRIVFAGEIDRSEAMIKIPNPRLWSPEDPFLYDIALALCSADGTILDAVTSYFGMRKFSIGYDDKRIPRLCLNNKPYFQNGLLDQGYWSDGGLTAPCDEALIFDIKAMKDLGFNMLRKHIKVEPQRWYYHCDRLGMIVWQDMVCGAEKIDNFVVGFLPNIGIRKAKDSNYALFKVAPEECRREHEKAMYETIDNLYNFPSIGCWVPFNEAWGQFDAKRIGEQVKAYDPSRIVDHASGWHDQGGPEINSMHRYILPVTMRKNDGRPFALTEFGGYSRKIENHMWNAKKSFGYIMFKDKTSLTKAYERLFERQIIPKISKGLCATVYTQVSDVEFEVNGIFTYDRELIKIDENTIKSINEKMKY